MAADSLLNRRFERLVVIADEGLVPRKSGTRSDHRWLCRCDCGKLTSLRTESLTSGNTRSCGCLHDDVRVAIKTTHGRCKSPTWRSWASMKYRCYNERDGEFKNYGARGILVCQCWMQAFENFLDDMGEKPSRAHQIDRINNDGHYSCGHCAECIANGWPANCRWATASDQSRNKRTNVVVEIDGVRRPLCDWLSHFKIPRSTYAYRVEALGMTAADAIIVPRRRYSRHLVRSPL